MQKILLILGLFLIAIIGCKKRGKSPQELIIGKWNLTGVNFRLMVKGKAVKDSIFVFSPGNYLDFISDNQLNKHDSMSYPVNSTFFYTFKDNHTIIVDTGINAKIFPIRKLTNTDLVLVIETSSISTDTLADNAFILHRQ